MPTHVRRLDRSNDPLSGELTLVEQLSEGDCILCVAGEILPCNGTVVDGTALMNRASVVCPTPTAARTRIGSRVIAGAIVLSKFVILRVGDDDTA